MPLHATSDASSANMRRDVLWPVCCLGLLLVLLFLRSFDSRLAVFSNDGPLGQVSAAAEYALSNFRGYWQDLNWIGIEQLPAFPTLGYLSIVLFGPVGHGKFVAPISLLVLGLSAWLCLYRMGFNRWVCLLGSLAAAFDMSVFSNTCWGLCGWTFQRAFTFLALAGLVNPRNRYFTLRLMLAGSCVGLGIMEGFDVGAIFSLYVAAFVAFQAWVQKETLAAKLVAASSRVALVAVCAGLIAAHALTSLIGTQVKGVAEMQQDPETKQKRWNAATQWSLPKIETLRIIIPGLFGYRMNDAEGQVYEKSYWGSIAQTPGWEQHRKGMARHTGSGDYAGVLVVLVAIWATAQGWRRKGGPFDQTERKLILFWAGAAVVSLLLAFGWHAPFYQLVYALPYFSTIRNPVKFLYPMHFALVILFGYGLQGLWRQHVAISAGRALTGSAALKSWWKTAPSWDRKWTIGSIAAIGASLVGWLMYASSKGGLVRHLQNIGFSGLQLATSMANQSLNEVGWFVLFLGLSVGVVMLIISGRFTAKRSRLAAACLGLVLVTDMVRANLPWIVYYDYKEKYATNPIIDFLKQKPYDHRVTAVVSPLSRSFLVDDQDRGVFPNLSYEWLQHQFPYYQVQSLDVISMARPQEFDEAYMAAFRPTNASEFRLCARLWELTNTRYVLGMTGYLEALNQQFDAGKRRFAVHTAFNVVPKPGLANATKLEDLTALPGTNGQYALFEFSGALPRARLFGEWQVSTNDPNTLQRLKSPDFDPARTVLIADELPPAAASSSGTPTAGSVEFAFYSPKLIRLSTKTAAPAILVLNDRHHPNWKAFVNGRAEPLLRCNYAMRGVYLTPGDHTVEFRFEPPAGPLYLTCASIAVAFGICFFLAVAGRSGKPKKSPAETAGQPLSSHRKSK